VSPTNVEHMDSFLWQMVQELLQLAIGVSAFDAIAQVSFLVSFLFCHFQLFMNYTGYFCVTCLPDCFW
jgi:hypothetical protein